MTQCRSVLREATLYCNRIVTVITQLLRDENGQGKT